MSPHITIITNPFISWWSWRGFGVWSYPTNPPRKPKENFPPSPTPNLSNFLNLALGFLTHQDTNKSPDPRQQGTSKILAILLRRKFPQDGPTVSPKKYQRVHPNESLVPVVSSYTAAKTNILNSQNRGLVQMIFFLFIKGWIFRWTSRQFSGV